MKDKRKLAASLTAGGMAAALLLTGTFAWQSISQKAKNEIMAETNPGGRLHDDFNGKNKDIYVENFTDEVEGAPIFARVRLREYLEVGTQAGNPTADDYAVTVIGNPDAKFDDTSTWTIHNYGTDHLVFHDYITWDEDGGSTVYMPTFNKNKDSLLSDINGTLEGPDGLRPGVQGDKYDKYQDYKSYNVGDTVQGNAIYDADEDNDDEVGNDLIPDTVTGGVTVDGTSQAVDGDDYTLRQETHQAQETQNCTVITYAQWKAKPDEEKVGNYWVYDTDGWAYWAAPIMPGTATGLLLDGVSVKQSPGLEWYYAIDVEAQFATANDWGTANGGEDKKGDGFYASANGGMQASGEEILGMAAESLNNKITISLNNTVKDLDTVDSFVAQPGDRARFSVEARINGKEHQLTKEELKDVTWSVTGGNVGTTNVVAPFNHVISYNSQVFDYSHNSALLTIDDAVVPGTTLSVTAEYQGLTDRVEVQVKNLGYEELGQVIPGTLTTVTIDGHGWYVLAKNGDQVLLWADDSVGLTTYSGQVSNCSWENSAVRSYLINTFYPTLNILKRPDVAVSTTLSSWDGMGYDPSINWHETSETIFLLTEADLKGTASEYTGWSSSAGACWAPRKVELKDYTYQVDGVGQVVAPDVGMWMFDTIGTGGSPDLSPLRNNSGYMKGHSYSLTSIGKAGWFVAYENSGAGSQSPIRPAMWVNMGVEVAP